MRILAALLCLAALAACTQPAPKTSLTSNFVWDRQEAWFGGFSGLEVAPNGIDATMITDKGRLVQARLIRNNGRISHVDLAEHTALKSASGRTLKSLRSDSEGLAIAPDGSTFVSFEQRHRVTRMDPTNAVTSNLTPVPANVAFEPNKGFEALAVDADGTVYAVSESRQSDSPRFDLLYLKDGRWQVAYRLAFEGRFVPVGADFDDQGRLYILERATTPLGFRSRVRRLTFGASSLREAVLLTSRPSQFGNLEGLSVWTDPAGHMRVTMISDDNFTTLLRTQIVEYTIR